MLFRSLFVMRSDPARPEIRGVISYGRDTDPATIDKVDRWEFEVVPNTSRVQFRPFAYDAQLEVTLVQNVNTLNVSSTTGLLPGQRVFGEGIPAGTTITNITGTVVTLSQATTLRGTKLLGFYTLNAPAEPQSISLSVGEVSTLANGQGNGERAYVTVKWSAEVETALTNPSLAKKAPPRIDTISYGYDTIAIPDRARFLQTETDIAASPIDLDRAVNPTLSSTSFTFDVTAKIGRAHV